MPSNLNLDLCIVEKNTRSCYLWPGSSEVDRRWDSGLGSNESNNKFYL